VAGHKSYVKVILVIQEAVLQVPCQHVAEHCRENRALATRVFNQAVGNLKLAS